MTSDQIEQLRQDIANLTLAAQHLNFSIARCQPILAQTSWTPEEQERLESLCSRFARLADLLIQRVMRLVDYIELTPEGSLLDRIHRAEKRGWGGQPGTLVRIRELRNIIAHEYAAEKMAQIYATTAKLAPELLNIIPAVVTYCDALTVERR